MTAAAAADASALVDGAPRVYLPALHPAQQRVVDEAARFNVLDCGRRWGKTTLLVEVLVEPAVQGYPVGGFWPSYKMMAEVWRDLRRALSPITERTNAQEHRLELITGGSVDLWSLDRPDAARGRKYKKVVTDEAAMVRHMEDAWNAVIRPTLVDMQGEAWFASTPKGLNFFKILYDLGQDPRRGDWRSWRMPTSTNPYIVDDEIEAARLLLPERTFAQEFEALFLEDGGGVFRKVKDAAGATPQDQRVEGHRYVVGVDWGKLEDFTVLCVVDATAREVVCLDRFNKIDYAVQTGRLRALCERFRPDAVYAEQNSMGVPLVETLQRMNLPVYPFLTTNASKLAVIDALALAFEREEIRIPDDPVLLGELLAYEAERLPSGTLRYGAPQGQHDDCVMALAIAWQGAQASPVAWY